MWELYTYSFYFHIRFKMRTFILSAAWPLLIRDH